MKKVTDERIVFENLKHIKTAFLVQTLGIVLILAVDGARNGYEHARSNPLWLLVLVTAIVLSYSRLRTAVESERPGRKPFSYGKAVIGPLAAGIAVFAAAALFSETSMMNAVMLGAALFAASLIPALLITFYRKKNQDEDDI